jgi:hypothetical protein
MPRAIRPFERPAGRLSEKLPFSAHPPPSRFRQCEYESRAGEPADAEGFADLIVFGRPYIANPDLVNRFTAGTPLAEVDWETVYGSGSDGYSDYPSYQRSQPTIR